MSAGYWTCRCEAVNAFRATVCEHCGEARESKAGSAPQGHVCQDCQGPTSIRLGAIVVVEKFLCRECHWARLKAQRSEPGDACTEPGCDVTVEQHIRDFRKFGELIEVRSVKL